MYKERKGMGLDSPLMPNELQGCIFFLPSFSSSSSYYLFLLLGRETGKCLINVLEKTSGNVYQFIMS